MSFFAGASNVRIMGGEFNVVKGNLNVFDQSRHHTNVHSFNTRNITTMDSHNDNSKRYYGGDPSEVPQLPPPGPRDQETSLPYGPNGYFPPPTIHPAMRQPEFLPPGSHTQNYDSFNVDNRKVDNISNNYSQEYGAPLPSTRRRRRRLVGQSNANSEDMEEDEEEDEDMPNPPHPPMQTGPSSLGNVSYGDSRLNQGTGGAGFAQRGFPLPAGVPYVNGHRPGSYSTANYLPGHIQPMSPDIQQSIALLMEQVKQQTAPEPQQAMSLDPQHQRVTQHGRYGEHDRVEEQDSDSDEEGDTRMRDPLTDNMANLSLNDELRPAFSRVKSDPQLPMTVAPTHLNVPLTRIEPRQAESTQDLPDRLREPFVNAAPAGHPLPYQQTPPVSLQAASSIPAAFGMNHPGVSVEGSPIYRDISGNYNKIDNSYNAMNIASGNTENTLIKDSYNDGSLKHFAPPEAKKTGKKQGRIWK